MTKIISKTGSFVQYGQIAISAAILFMRVADLFVDRDNKSEDIKTLDTIEE